MKPLPDAYTEDELQTKDKLRPYGKDHFWNYLWYCYRYEMVSPGQYLELIDMTTVRSFRKLVGDLSDTRKAGYLRAVPLKDGGMGYEPVQEGIFTNGNVRKRDTVKERTISGKRSTR